MVCVSLCIHMYYAVLLLTISHIHYVNICYVTGTHVHVTAVLCADDHTEISLTTMTACHQWRAIGGKLGFTFDELDSIVCEPGRHGDVEYYQAKMVGLGTTQPS